MTGNYAHFLLEGCGFLNFRKLERRWMHSVTSPWAHSDSLCTVAVNLSTAGSYQQDLHHDGGCPFIPTTSVVSDPSGESAPMATPPSHDLHDAWKASSLTSLSAISSTSAEMRTRWFPMSRRRDADHSRHSPVPRPTEKNDQSFNKWESLEEK